MLLQIKIFKIREINDKTEGNISDQPAASSKDSKHNI